MKTLAFAASNSSQSINHKLVSYVADLFDNPEVIKLTDYPLPMYCIDLELSEGVPKNAQALLTKIVGSEHIIISVCEHNGSVSAFFKNTIDWITRENRSFLKGKKITLLSASPGANGGASALEQTEKMLPFFGAEILSSTSIGQFNDHYDQKAGLDQETKTHLRKVVSETFA